MQRIERERARFFRHHFGVDPDDPMRYDITINLARLSLDQSVAMILEARSILRAGS
jgi:cytidylate kinase